MGTKEAICAIFDYPETVEKYFRALEENHERLIDVINSQDNIELFAPKLILGISDEMPSTGNMERVRLVGKIVDEYNASQESSTYGA